jgi:cold-inducible RNA-binding protein
VIPTQAQFPLFGRRLSQAQAQETTTMGRKLYVGNLSYHTGEAELQALFGQIGEVDTVSIVTDRATGQPRGFAFVEMRNDADAQRAITELNEREHDGRRLTVNEARPKPTSGGGGGFGGGGGGSRRRSDRRW